MNRLEAREIVVEYGRATPPVLAELSLALRSGELLGVVGPNGSGKSTLVRALSRALEPVHGDVHLSGCDLYHEVSARGSAQQIAVVPQDTAIPFDFSVREVVEMGRAPRLPRRPFASLDAADEAAVNDSLHQAGVAGLAERAVPTLSGGERQRVLLARALAQAGDALLLDEPTAHLDLRHQAETLSLLRNLAHSQGKAALAVLHDLNLAAAYCDRLALLHQGSIAALGRPWEVLTPENIARVYDSPVWVRCHPITGRPYLLPLPEANSSVLPSSPHVLVLCGGGTGAGLLAGLRRRGLRVTAGALNQGDADAEAAAALGIAFLEEKPFSPLSAAVIAETGSLARAADAVLLAEMPVGPMNLALLSVAVAARQAGKPVVCVQSAATAFSARDFTGGHAAQEWDALRAAGAMIAPDAEAAQDQIALLLEQMPSSGGQSRKAGSSPAQQKIAKDWER